MQIGAMNQPSRNPVQEIQWFGQNGFDFVDLTLEPPAADPDDIDVEAVRGALERHSLGVVAHTAYYLPIASPFPSLRQVCLEEFKRALQVAHRIGATVMNTHFDKPPKFFSEAETVQWHVKVLRPLCDEASQVGVTVVLEQIPFGGNNQLDMIDDILEQVPLLRLHLDSGHAKLERDYDRWDEYLDRLGHKLRHVHLSENDGTDDQHLPLGSSPRSKTDWPEHIGKLKSSGYDGTITLEVFMPQREYLLLSRDLLRTWWDEA